MEWLQDFAQWLLETFLYVPRWVWDEVLTALSAVIAGIPVPDFVLVWTSNAGSLPASIIWFLTMFEFKAGLTMIASAYIARWKIRRIPFVG